ncbi:MAG: hypothetical protein JSS11_01985 [Verrucomicrobia bacterium]|nr:hypothetical protein [Verrucomicrobiota bacterium]
MNKKTRTKQLHVVNPGILSGVTFVAWYEVDDCNQPTDDFLFDDDTQDEQLESTNKTDWKQTVATPFQKGWDRLIRQLPWRKAA